MRHRIVSGDLLDQPVDAIVNSWNRNLIPWWLLLPQGVSGAIKKRAGIAPFKELGRSGMLPLGSAVLTGAGRLPFRGIIHVAGINLLWRASELSIRLSVRSACAIAERERFGTLAVPIVGAGSGGFDEEQAASIILEELDALAYETEVLVVRYRKGLVEGMRGLGLSSVLQDYAMTFMKRHAVQTAQLSVSPTNPRALAYYRKHGWSDMGLRPGRDNVHLMECAVPAGAEPGEPPAVRARNVK